MDSSSVIQKKIRTSFNYDEGDASEDGHNESIYDPNAHESL